MFSKIMMLVYTILIIDVRTSVLQLIDDEWLGVGGGGRGMAPH